MIMIDDFVREITKLRCENSSLKYELEKLKKKYENAVADYETTMFEKKN